MPWHVLNMVLRPKPFDTHIIEIHDADGEIVIPWGGFDQMRGSHTAKLKLARRICRAVNLQQAGGK
jgi:hypothetical protein